MTPSRVFLALFFAAAIPAAAFAQQPGVRVGEVDQSVRRSPDPEERVSKAAPKLDAPAAPSIRADSDAKIRLRVARLAIRGNKSFSAEELLAATTSVAAGGEMTLAQIKDQAEGITRYYRERGFGLAWAYVPEQEIKEGVVEIAIVEGRIGNILVEGNHRYSANFILSHFEGLPKASATDLEELELTLMRLNEYRGLSTRAVLRPGDQPGTTDLYLTAEEKFPVSFSMDYDNFGAESVGEHRIGATAGLYHVFAETDTIELRGASAINAADGELAYGRLTYELTTRDYSKVTAYASFYNYQAKGDVAVLDPTGTGEVYGVTVGHSFIKKTGMSLTLDVGFEWKDLVQELLGSKIGEDRLRVLIVDGVFEWTDDFLGRWVVLPQLREGLGEFAGGLGNNDPDASRVGADGAFTRLTLDVYRLQKVASWLHLVGRTHLQWAGEPLVVSEQMAVGGQDSVRGYPPFEFMGDKGYTASLEARIGLPFLESVTDPFNEKRSIVDMIQIAAFIDAGEGVRLSPLPGERAKQMLSGYGVGVRLNYPDRFSVRFDVGWPLSDKDPSNGDNQIYYVSVILNLN